MATENRLSMAKRRPAKRPDIRLSVYCSVCGPALGPANDPICRSTRRSLPSKSNAHDPDYTFANLALSAYSLRRIRWPDIFKGQREHSLLLNRLVAPSTTDDP